METLTRYRGPQYTGGDKQCKYEYLYGKNDRFLLHCHDYYEIFLTASGQLNHHINGKLQTLPENSLVFIRPNDIHGYVYDTEESRNVEYANLTFTREMATSLFEYLSPDFPTQRLLNVPMPPTVVLNNTAKKRILSQFNTLQTLSWENNELIRMRTKSILADIFVQHFCASHEDEKADIPLWFSMLLKEMENEDNFIAGADRMVELSNKSREHLSRTTKKYLGLSLSEYINNLRLNYAANLILSSNIPMIDVCYNCGFQNLGYFYKEFKERYRYSPAQFAKKYKNGAAL